jgi:chromosome segregation ATPase
VACRARAEQRCERGNRDRYGGEGVARQGCEFLGTAGVRASVATNAEDAFKAAHAEIRSQRSTIADLLGRIRDLETDDARHAVGRLSTDNAALQQRVRELTAHNRMLEERLQAARSNARFLDKRVAELEASILQQPATSDAARQPT